MYTILIDECKDNAGHEELSTRMKETDVQTITRERVLPISKEFDSFAVLLSLGAGGVSVMSGCNESVAAKLEKTYLLRWFESCLTNRRQKCDIDGHLSNSTPVSNLWRSSW